MTSVHETRASRAILEWLNASATEDGPHTQGVLAERLSKHIGRPVSQSSISHIARGMQKPRAELMVALRAEIGIEVDWWLVEPEPATEPVAVESDSPAA